MGGLKLKKLITVVMLLICVVCTLAVAAEELTFCGAGINYEITEALAKAFVQENPGIQVSFPEKIGTGAAVKQVTAGKIDFGLMARPLTANEAELGLQYIPYAEGAVAFVVHESIEEIENLTSKQILDIYSGKISNWNELSGPDEMIVAMSREPEAAAMLLFNEAIEGWEKMQVRDDAIIALTTEENNENLSFMPYSIGFTDLGSLNAGNLPVKPLSIDGVYPSLENIASGKYPLVSELGFCIKSNPTGVIAKFLDFLKSDQAEQILKEYGYTPAL